VFAVDAVNLFPLQANRTASLVHKILIKTRDPEVREEVRSNAWFPEHCYSNHVCDIRVRGTGFQINSSSCGAFTFSPV